MEVCETCEGENGSHSHACPKGIIDDNMQAYFEEASKAHGILQQNRHRSVEPYDWFGPDPEPSKPGKDCECSGCEVRNFEWKNR